MKRQQLADAMERLLSGRWKSVHNLHRETGVSREALTRMQDGFPVELETVERFARAIGEPVNVWRQLNGYPAIVAEQPPFDPDAAFMEGVRLLREEFGGDYQFSLGEFPFSEATPEEIAAALAAIRQRLEERR